MLTGILGVYLLFDLFHGLFLGHASRLTLDSDSDDEKHEHYGVHVSCIEPK